MAVTIVGNNTPTAGGIIYGDGTNYASTSAGSAGQLLTSAGASPPTWADAPAPVPTFTATGSISAAGVTVALNSDGTVSQISGTATSFSAGTTANLPSNRTGSYSATAYDPVNQKVLVLVQYSSYLMGYVGTISGTTITYGSEYQIVTSSVGDISVAYDTVNNKFVVLYTTANTQRAKVLTVSGTAISAGAEKILTNSAGYAGGNDIAYNSVFGNFVVVAYDNNNIYTSLWLLTISGTSVVESYYPASAMMANFWGTAVACSPATGTVALGGRATTSGNYPYLYVVTVSASTVLIGASIQLSSTAGGDFTRPIFFGSSTEGYGLAVAFTASGTNNAVLVRSGKEVDGNFFLGGTYASGSNYSVSNFAIQVNLAGSNIVIAWSDGSTGYGIALTATVNKGGAVVFGSANNLFTPVNNRASLAYCPNISAMVFVSVNSSNSRYTTIVFTPDGYASNSQSFIGFSTGPAANGASVGVSTYASVNSNVSGLTLGSRYNLTYTGSLSTSSTGFPVAGTAYNATKILVGM